MKQSFENLGNLRTGRLTPLLDFYSQHHDLFARWARRQVGASPEAAHAALQAALLDFYDRTLDGRITAWPTDLRADIYAAAQRQLAPSGPPAAALPAPEAARRQILLSTFSRLSDNCRQVLRYFYFNNYRFAKLAGKMGYANATVARIQKADCLRVLHEALTRADAPGAAAVLPHLAEIEGAFDGHLSADEQDEFDERMLNDADLRQACLTYEQYAADLRWAAGRDLLQRRLEAADRRTGQRAKAQMRIRQRQRWQQFRWVRLLAGILVGFALLLLALRFFKPVAAWETYDIPDTGLSDRQTEGRPLLTEAMHDYHDGNYGTALRTLRRLSPLEIGQDTFMYYSGLMLLRQGQADYAENYFQSVSDAPNSRLRGQASFYLGLAHWQQKEMKPAKAALQRAAAQAPEPYRENARRALVESKW